MSPEGRTADPGSAGFLCWVLVLLLVFSAGASTRNQALPLLGSPRLPTVPSGGGWWVSKVQASAPAARDGVLVVQAGSWGWDEVATSKGGSGTGLGLRDPGAAGRTCKGWDEGGGNGSGRIKGATAPAEKRFPQGSNKGIRPLKKGAELAAGNSQPRRPAGVRGLRL